MRKILTQPSNLPISLSDAKEFVRVEHEYDDTILTQMIKAATKTAEAFTGLQLTSGTFLEAREYFERKIKLLSPTTSITSVKYYDTDNVLQTIDSSNYRLNTFGKQHYLEFDVNFTFPDTYVRNDVLLIEFEAGYTDIPEDVESWINIRVSTLYDNRSELVEGYGTLSKIEEKFLNNLLYSHKVW